MMAPVIIMALTSVLGHAIFLLVEDPTVAKKGMGFNKAANSISDMEKVPIKVADKILASRTRAASPAAKKANPNLKKVK